MSDNRTELYQAPSTHTQPYPEEDNPNTMHHPTDLAQTLLERKEARAAEASEPFAISHLLTEASQGDLVAEKRARDDAANVIQRFLNEYDPLRPQMYGFPRRNPYEGEEDPFLLEKIISGADTRLCRCSKRAKCYTWKHRMIVQTSVRICECGPRLVLKYDCEDPMNREGGFRLEIHSHEEGWEGKCRCGGEYGVNGLLQKGRYVHEKDEEFELLPSEDKVKTRVKKGEKYREARVSHQYRNICWILAAKVVRECERQRVNPQRVNVNAIYQEIRLLWQYKEKAKVKKNEPVSETQKKYWTDLLGVGTWIPGSQLKLPAEKVSSPKPLENPKRVAGSKRKASEADLPTPSRSSKRVAGPKRKASKANLPTPPKSPKQLVAVKQIVLKTVLRDLSTKTTTAAKRAASEGKSSTSSASPKLVAGSKRTAFAAGLLEDDSSTPQKTAKRKRST